MHEMKNLDRKLRVVKSDDGIDYFSDYLDLIKLPLVRLSEVATTPPPRYAIRHDVDHDIDTALLVAEAEANRGYKSTYFLLTPGSYGEETNYYGTIKDGVITHNPQLIEKCRCFIELGHDIGFHNDVISLALRFRKHPADILKREVDYFSDNGIPLIGTAAHGSPLANQLNYINMEIFEDCFRKKLVYGRTIEYKGWQVKLNSLKLIDFGFHYEAYSLPKDARISDSGGQWGGRIYRIKLNAELNGSFSKDKFLERLANLVLGKVYSLQILMHPCHWDVYDEAGIKISSIVRSTPVAKTD